jgi:hypothetical protein
MFIASQVPGADRMQPKHATNPARTNERRLAIRALRRRAQVQMAGMSKRFPLRRADLNPQAPSSKMPTQLGLERPRSANLTQLKLL